MGIFINRVSLDGLVLLGNKTLFKRRILRQTAIPISTFQSIGLCSWAWTLYYSLLLGGRIINSQNDNNHTRMARLYTFG